MTHPALLLIAVLAIASLLPQVHAQAEDSGAAPVPQLKGMSVTEIVIKGNQLTDRVFVLSRMKSKAGKAYDPDILDGDVKRLYETGYFNDVETRVTPVAGGVLVTIVVVENQVVARVLYEGRKKLRREDLRKVTVTSEGTWLDPADLVQDARRIVDLYRSKGYYHAAVTTDRKRVADGVDVYFNVSEGPRVTVDTITISGNKTLETKTLRKLMQTRESFWIFSPAFYDEDKLQSDIVNLRRFHRDEGFLDARVDLEEVKLSEDKKKIEIVILVEEGPRYKARKVEITGMDLFDKDRVLARMNIKPGGDYRTEDLIKDREQMKKAYGDAGFIFAEIGIETSYAGETHEVDITFTIKENQSVRIGLIHILGNIDTKDKVVRRDLEFYPNERASLSRLERSMNRLRARDYYETVEYEFTETEDPEVRDVIVKVKEKPTGKAKFGLGITSNQGIIGEISISKQNFDPLDLPRSFDDLVSGGAFTGAGQFFLIELQPGTEVNRFRVSFQEPYLFDRPISLTTGGFFYRRDRDEYDEERFGANIALGKRLTRDLGVELGYDFQIITIEDVDEQSATSIRDVEGTNVSSSLRLSFGIDKRDNPNFSTRGWRAGLTNELFGGPLGGDFDFYRVGANWSTFFTLWRDTQERPFVLALSGRTGVIFPYGDTESTPVFERYHAGGSSSLRGFQFRGIGPREGSDAVGGEAQLLGSAEFSFPIYDKLLRGVFFTDAGSLTTDYGDLFSTMRSTAGFGLQVFVPFLGPRPLEFSYAFVLKSEPGDEKEAFSFSFGRDF